MNEFDKIRRKLSELSDMVDSVEKSLTNDGDTRIEIEVPPADGKEWLAGLDHNDIGAVRIPYVEFLRAQMLRHSSRAVQNAGEELPNFWAFEGMSIQLNHHVGLSSFRDVFNVAYSHKDNNFRNLRLFASERSGAITPRLIGVNNNVGYMVEVDKVLSEYTKVEMESALAEYINMLVKSANPKAELNFAPYSPSLTN